MEAQPLLGLKRMWLRQRKLLASIALLSILIFVVLQYWQHHKTVRSEEASHIYSTLLEEGMNKHNLQILEAQGKTLLNDFRDTPYAQLAALLMAKGSMEKQDWDQALQHLRFAATQFPKGLVTAVARLRLAKVLGSRSQYDEALEHLKNPPTGYEGLYEEIKGDVYRAEKQFAQALNAYQASLTYLKDTSTSPILQMKVNEMIILSQSPKGA